MIIQDCECGGQVGLGDTRTTGAIVGAGANVANIALPGVFSSLGLTAAIPFVGPAIAGVTAVIGLFLSRKGPQQKVATTNIVNEIEPYLKENLRAWGESSKTRSEQRQALANFEQLWALMVQNCSDPNLGNPGKNCIADRSRGGKWDWWGYYYDPIANDSEVIEDRDVMGGSQVGFGSQMGFNPLIIGGLAVIGVLLFSMKK